MRINSTHSHWISERRTPAWNAWAGYAFESICFKHIDQIRKALQLEAISCEIGNWKFTPTKGKKESGAQIDLLFDREDGIISLCEIKYAEKTFILDKSEAKNLMNKVAVFEHHIPTKKQTLLALITTVGLKENIWSEELIQNVVTLEDLLQF